MGDLMVRVWLWDVEPVKERMEQLYRLAMDPEMPERLRAGILALVEPIAERVERMPNW